ncbi:MAG TPA: hypothetical protein VG892_07650 [Terriglobales bacterium]|nr:hypothetical protein [Terriglobales bacterium]
MSAASKNLEALCALEDNWDGYGGKRPTVAALQTVSEVFYVPVCDGGVQLEMHTGGMDIEISINPDGTIGSVYAGKP